MNLQNKLHQHLTLQGDGTYTEFNVYHNISLNNTSAFKKDKHRDLEWAPTHQSARGVRDDRWSPSAPLLI